MYAWCNGVFGEGLLSARGKPNSSRLVWVGVVFRRSRTLRFLGEWGELRYVAHSVYAQIQKQSYVEVVSDVARGLCRSGSEAVEQEASLHAKTSSCRRIDESRDVVSWSHLAGLANRWRDQLAGLPETFKESCINFNDLLVDTCNLTNFMMQQFSRQFNDICPKATRYRQSSHECCISTSLIFTWDPFLTPMQRIVCRDHVHWCCMPSSNRAILLLATAQRVAFVLPSS